jgi:hypothetical protein
MRSRPCRHAGERLVAWLATCEQLPYVVTTVMASRFTPGLMMNGAVPQSDGKAASGGNRRFVTTTA